MNRDNMNFDAKLLRDTFLKAEREYVMTLLQDEKIRRLVIAASQYGSEALFGVAQKIVDKVDAGLIPDDQMELAEQQLTVLLAAIQDRALIKNLVLTLDDGKELEVVSYCR